MVFIKFESQKELMRLVFCIFLLSMPLIARAQYTDPEENNEIGIAASYVRIIEEKENATGLHAHYLRKIKGTRFSAGVAFEKIFDEHGHNTIALSGSFSPVRHLDISFSPGITFRDREKVKPGFHIEFLYEIEAGVLHIGPVGEVAVAAGDYHMSLGLHAGFGF